MYLFHLELKVPFLDILNILYLEVLYAKRTLLGSIVPVLGSVVLGGVADSRYLSCFPCGAKPFF